jgi:hypothetical protein
MGRLYARACRLPDPTRPAFLLIPSPGTRLRRRLLPMGARTELRLLPALSDTEDADNRVTCQERSVSGNCTV